MRRFRFWNSNSNKFSNDLAHNARRPARPEIFYDILANLLTAIIWPCHSGWHLQLSKGLFRTAVLLSMQQFADKDVFDGFWRSVLILASCCDSKSMRCLHMCRDCYLRQREVEGESRVGERRVLLTVNSLRHIAAALCKDPRTEN